MGDFLYLQTLTITIRIRKEPYSINKKQDDKEGNPAYDPTKDFKNVQSCLHLRPRVLLMCLWVPRIGSVLVTIPNHVISRRIIEGRAILMYDIFAVSYVGIASTNFVSTGLVTVFPLLDLSGRLLILGLGLAMGTDLGGCLPPFESFTYDFAPR